MRISTRYRAHLSVGVEVASEDHRLLFLLPRGVAVVHRNEFLPEASTAAVAGELLELAHRPTSDAFLHRHNLVPEEEAELLVCCAVVAFVWLLLSHCKVQVVR